MLTIEKEQLEALKNLVYILGALFTGFLFVGGWLIRIVDYGGRKRAEAVAIEMKTTVEILNLHINSLEQLQDFYLTQIEQYKDQIKDLNKRLEELQNKLDGLKMEMNLLKEHAEARARMILANALKLIVDLGYSESLGKKYLDYLDGNGVSLEEFEAELNKEQIKNGATQYPFNKENK